jgi:hypothetical protein
MGVGVRVGGGLDSELHGVRDAFDRNIHDATRNLGIFIEVIASADSVISVGDREWTLK